MEKEGASAMLGLEELSVPYMMTEDTVILMWPGLAELRGILVIGEAKESHDRASGQPNLYATVQNPRTMRPEAMIL